MGVLTTKAEQMRAARVAKKVGGYSELIRLSRDKARIVAAKGEPVLVREPDGRYRFEDKTGRFRFDHEYPRHIYYEHGWWWVRDSGGERQFATREQAVQCHLEE